MKEFLALLDKYNETPIENHPDVEKKIWDIYGKEVAIFVLDMSGFSQLVQKHGILHYLAMVRRMQVVVKPIVEKFGGSIVKFEADNCFAHFVSVEKAIRAGISINIALDAMNTMTGDNKDLHVSVGIGYGKVLLIENKDYFGNAVNLASKLGEDIAGRGEILVNDEAMTQLGEDASHFSFETSKMSISGIELVVNKVVY